MPNEVLFRPNSIESSHFGLTNNQLGELQHFIELGRLSASLIHEISGPLTSALLYLDSSNSSTSINLRQARRNLLLLRKYVEAARQQVICSSEQFSTFCINPQIEKVKRLVLPLAKTSSVQLVFENMVHYQLYGDPIKFQQIMANLVINAIDSYANSPDNLTKPVRVSVTGTDKFVSIKVVDWGEGIPPDHIARIFEPFYTTKNNKKHGLGIGLTIVKEHVNLAFSGSIKVSSTARSGTQFSLRLPAKRCPTSHFPKKALVLTANTL